MFIGQDLHKKINHFALGTNQILRKTTIASINAFVGSAQLKLERRMDKFLNFPGLSFAIIIN